jgi:hypothetical protein
MATKLKYRKSGDEILIVHCYSSNLGTFWLKIEQFWPFKEINILGNSGHLEWRAGPLIPTSNQDGH